MHRAAPVLSLLVMLLFAGCASGARHEADHRASSASDAPEAGEKGKPGDCVAISNIREAHIVSDQVIDFRTASGAVLRNTLPQACPRLGIAKAFTYPATVDRLCKANSITVIRQDDGVSRGASCALGSFTPTADMAG